MKIFDSWATWRDAEGMLSPGFPSDTMEFLGNVYAFAEQWHDGQTRPAGEPYIAHLLEVLEILAVGAGVTDSSVLATGLLHDVVEDTPCTLVEVRQNFGDQVTKLVDWLTKPDPEPGQGKDVARENYLRRFAHAPYSVLSVKLADRYSNVQRLHTHPRLEKQCSYYTETCHWFTPLAARVPYFQELFAAWRTSYEYLTGGLEKTGGKTLGGTSSNSSTTLLN